MRIFSLIWAGATLGRWEYVIFYLTLSFFIIQRIFIHFICLTLFIFSSFLFTLFAISPEVMHWSNESIHLLNCSWFQILIWIHINKFNKTRQNLWVKYIITFCQNYSLWPSQTHSLSKVTINYGHQFAQIISLKLSNTFELFSISLLAQI